MYYRRKFVLGLIERSGGELNKTRLQKLLLLASRGMDKKPYDFIPYQYGCYSFTANYDLGALIKHGLIEEEHKNSGSSWKYVGQHSYFQDLKLEDRQRISSVVSEFGNFSNENLIRHTYTKFPFWATKSTIAEKILTKQELEKVNSQKKVFHNEELFTIGYEGISLETYINKLIVNDIRVLCDVRKNPLSMKYGFSKSQLKHACEGVGIRYEHIPQLGIISDKRQELNNLSDYNKLFTEYEKTTLIENAKFVDNLLILLRKEKRIALTCFEKESCMCHRGRVAQNLLSLDDTICLRHL